ncbi:E3 ubiquitin-protein ligase TRIM39-like [Genypterus blacodes]|uniref:E3 ubiquitin-protein ligase TRIM39-like n=1 Tax=Genypterus blacodes TaxID=154954 RepID=UPI003F76940E
MAAANILSGEIFLCAICYDVFTKPVTTPCGHNYCCICINQYWDCRGIYQCPLCKREYSSRPELHVNTCLSELVIEYKKSILGNASSPALHYPETTVPCDICSVIKVEAAKSCLTCLTSLCEVHLEPHDRVPVLRSHTLVEPIWNIGERVCTKHTKLKEMYCRTEKICICVLCSKTNHKDHNVVSVEEAYDAEKDEIMTNIQSLLNSRTRKIRELEKSMVISLMEADREEVATVKVFTDLISSIWISLAEVITVIHKRHQVVTQRAVGCIRELRVEMFDLQCIRTQVERVLLSKDRHAFLQSLLTLHRLPLKDWSSVSVNSDLCVKSLRTTVALVKKNIAGNMELLPERKIKKLRRHAVNLTLDPSTAHGSLAVSQDGKQVTYARKRQNLPKRPDAHPDILVKEGFTTGSFYFEVLVKGKTKWAVGVMRESVDRKANPRLCTTNGFWTIGLDGGVYKAYGMSHVKIPSKHRPQRVGVFVDFGRGLVSFYDADSKSWLYSFYGHCFREKLYPYFCPQDNKEGTNSAPLILTDVTPHTPHPDESS